MSSSESESEYETELSGEEEDEKQVKELEKDLARMSEMVKLMTENIHELESAMTGFHRPLESLHVDQMGGIPFLASSPFRHQTFAVKPPGFPGIDLDRRYPFHVICNILRTHLLSTDAVQDNGTITLTKPLQKLFGVKESETTFLELILHLRKVLV